MENKGFKFFKKGSAFLIAPALSSSFLPGMSASTVGGNVVSKAASESLLAKPDSGALNLLSEHWGEFLLGSLVIVGLLAYWLWPSNRSEEVLDENMEEDTQVKSLAEDIEDYAKKSTHIDLTDKKVKILSREFEYSLLFTSSGFAFLEIEDKGSRKKYLVYTGNTDFIFVYKERNNSGFYEDLKAFDLKKQSVVSLGDGCKSQNIVSAIVASPQNLQNWRYVDCEAPEYEDLRNIGVCVKVIKDLDYQFWNELSLNQKQFFNGNSNGIMNNMNGNIQNNFGNQNQQWMNNNGFQGNDNGFPQQVGMSNPQYFNNNNNGNNFNNNMSPQQQFYGNNGQYNS